jgi:hypothetical protein
MYVQRVQQPLHVQRCKVRIPSFLNLYQAVERCVEVYRGLEIMYFDFLHQGLATVHVLQMYNTHCIKTMITTIIRVVHPFIDL